MIPSSFALIIIPSVPVIDKPSLAAIFLALISSKISKELEFYSAKAIALDSPLSICISNKR